MSRLVESLRQPVILTRGHVILHGALSGLTVAGLIFFVIYVVDNLDQQREDRLNDRLSAQVTQKQVRKLTTDLRAYSRSAARAAKPTDEEIADAALKELNACRRIPRCHAQIVRTVNSIVRVTNERIVPAPPGQPRPPPASTPGRTVVVQGKPVSGRDGAAGKDGAPGKGFDSSLLDVLDWRIADLERIVGALGATVDDLLGLLCRPALARLLSLIGICP